MRTDLLPELLDTAAGREADAILRACVHCGFCTATCPTYQLLGDELDGPRGRIYQIKRVMEGAPATAVVQRHLDRCLGCRACERTCPSGVRYARLAEIGRGLVAAQVRRPWHQRLLRRALVLGLSGAGRVRALLALGRLARPLLPARLAARIPSRVAPGAAPTARGLERRMLVLEGCVQGGATPRTNAAAARVFARLGIELVGAPAAGCCGALAYHLDDQAGGRARMRQAIDAWWPEIESGCEAILVTASGCASMVREYGEVLADDPDYAERAARVAALARDPAEVLAVADLTPLGRPGAGRRLAYHAPCSQQHVLRLDGVVEGVLERLGFTLVPVPDAHLCCGSAGTYSITQPALSRRLLENKLGALESGRPALIATANVGCQLQLAAGASVAVVHWLELLDPAPPEEAPER
ncbi:glycolate oxidase subunit GlcF [Marichromatium bheemlicum]|uniref:Glycolate oxidase iron-sulfur subunit n=1 Tax=Marichromatium bheemlicum TaxID=365339 RepID=A0ABX1I6M7_9GAMM|nr:glycolate oxidase subunit GlcF [Marichromatium bheemlicum]NKN32396.1 glycolate oxidase subunit GlcF [Marichromatium bheemlicum]